MTPELLHYLLTRQIVETGHAPGIERAAALAGCNEAEVADALHSLAEMHGVILEPESLRI
jgi:hypothetical protein